MLTYIKSLLKRYFILLLCLLVLCFLTAIIGYRALLTYALLVYLIVTIDGLIKRRLLADLFTSLMTFIFSVTAFVEVGHAFMFKDRIEESTFFILFETNLSESKEFLLSATGFVPILLMVLFFALLGLALVNIFWGKGQTRAVLFRKTYWRLKFFSIISSLGLLYYLRTSLLLYITLQSFSAFQAEKEKLLNLVSDKRGGDFDHVEHLESDADEVYVLVIGESTTRRCMGIYDYYRMTTPRLYEMREELFVYKDVITPHTHTIAALGKALTMSSFKDSIQEVEGSLIQLFNKAGFVTYWLSNQKPIGIYESTVTALSQSAEHRTFTNVSSGQVDGVLLKPFSDALRDEAPKKLIVVHLMGTHMQYSKRYPARFDFFKSQPRTNYNYEKSWKSINTYDNAVLYNDYVLESLIRQLRNVEGRTALLYFSDHGEEVYHTKAFAMHAETNETKDMYDIPFILWGSEAFVRDSALTFQTDRKYSIEDLIYSLADMARIRFDQFDAQRSIFNPDFKETKRYITQKRVYDEVYAQ